MGLFSKKKKNDGYDYKGTLRHLFGLEIPENITCTVAIKNNELSIITGANEYTLKIDKIISVDFDMNVDVEKYTKSSIAKGIIGAATFGVAGAVIGSAPKTKEKRNVTCKAIINYENSNGESTYIILEDFEVNSRHAAKLVDKLRTLINNNQVKKKIEL